ncbi:hypothetical protein ACERIM_09165 [Natrinema sp. H-ect1]|uniref:hypothetical protein n=1 Tax=Natrinema sp. H-ect1 TaxID=3242700 RepID=UPI00359E5B3E
MESEVISKNQLRKLSVAASVIILALLVGGLMRGGSSANFGNPYFTFAFIVTVLSGIYAIVMLFRESE